MKIIFCLFALFAIVTSSASAQIKYKIIAKKNAEKRAAAKKAAKTKQKNEPSFTIPLIVKGENGDNIIEVGKGTKFIYEVNAAGSTYDFTVTLLHYSYNKGIKFSYVMSHNGNKGIVTIDSAGANSGNKYVNYFGNQDINLKDACAVWLSKQNFGDMPTKQTIMQMDDAEPENFYRHSDDAVAHEIILNGAIVNLDAFKITNDDDEKVPGSKSLIVHGISSNPLILKLDFGWTISLKEIITKN
jgi:hypothetical protein